MEQLLVQRDEDEFLELEAAPLGRAAEFLVDDRADFLQDLPARRCVAEHVVLRRRLADEGAVDFLVEEPRCRP